MPELAHGESAACAAAGPKSFADVVTFASAVACAAAVVGESVFAVCAGQARMASDPARMA